MCVFDKKNFNFANLGLQLITNEFDRRVQGQALRGPFLSRFLSNPLYSEHAESEETGFSPSSNPFAIRPAARTPTGAHIIFKQGVTPPQATPSADGEFFDLDLTLGKLLPCADVYMCTAYQTEIVI